LRNFTVTIPGPVPVPVPVPRLPIVLLLETIALLAQGIVALERAEAYVVERSGDLRRVAFHFGNGRVQEGYVL
jgi:hypothetical protein